MSERKKYVIAGKEFQLKDDIKLKERVEINQLTRKIPLMDNRNAEGLNYDETIRFLSLILEPAIENISMDLIHQIDEPTELAVFTDFFLRRMNLMKSGLQYLKNTTVN